MMHLLRICFALGILFISPITGTSQDYQAYNRLLKTYVDSDGNVNYKLLKKEKSTINQLFLDWQKIKAHQLSDKARLAFYINLYNLSTIKIILDYYPVKSIKDIKAGKIWDTDLLQVSNQKYTLNELENNLIRTPYKDARVHFLLNCGARSCPPLHNEAFTEKNIDILLDSKTKQFINDTRSNVIKAKQVKLCKIFDWYKSDFGDLVGFINKYSKIKIESKARITFLEYNWELNQP